MATRHSAQQLNTPVVLLVFNRPGTTARVFDAVRRARPTRLLVVADGPRAAEPDDPAQCAATRAVVEQVDWPCQLAVDYAPANQGAKRRVETGLDWVFAQVENAILLEDDCLPAPDFFEFCAALLDYYRDEPRVLTISGSNFQFGRHRGPASYYVSRYPLIWGWATWRRAWQAHDPAMTAWPALRDAGWLKDWLGDETAARYWAYLFQMTYEQHHAWDYPWVLSSWRRNGLSLIPAANLVSNIGYGPGATHTHQPDRFANLPLGQLDFPLRHPASLERDIEADAFTDEAHFSGNLRHLLRTARARVRAHPGEARP